MLNRVTCALLLLSFSVVPGQISGASLPGLLVCEDRNGQSDLTEGAYAPQIPLPGTNVPARVAVRVIPATNLALEGVEMLVNSPALVPGFIVLADYEVYGEDPATGLPDAAPLAQSGLVTIATPLANGLAWTGAAFGAPLTLAAGTPYWIAFDEVTGSGLTFGTQNLTGPDATTIALGNPIAGVPWTFDMVNERLKLRLLATSCATPSNADVTLVGAGCPAAAAPGLLTAGLPTVGNSGFAFMISGTQPNLAAALFWAPTADPVGTVVASMGCRLHLDLPGTLALLNVGLNPLQVGQAGLSGVATFPVPIPNDPALDGFSAAFQGLLVDPNGAPTGTPGLAIALTPAAVATIGL